MQRAEIEEMRQRDANLTALQAIGPRKRPRLEGDTVGSSVVNISNLQNYLRCVKKSIFTNFRRAPLGLERSIKPEHRRGLELSVSICVICFSI